MADTTTVDVVQALRELIKAVPSDDPPFSPPILVFPSQVAVDMARELDRLAIAEVTADDDGVKLVRVVTVRGADVMTGDEKLFLAFVDGMRFIEQRRISPMVYLKPRQDPEDKMARLRKLTGQDWRGRRG